MAKISEKTERKMGTYKLVRFEYKSGAFLGEYWYTLFNNGLAEKTYNSRTAAYIDNDWNNIINNHKKTVK